MFSFLLTQAIPYEHNGESFLETFSVIAEPSLLESLAVTISEYVWKKHHIVRAQS
jgi:hypothetical protein